MHSTVSRPRLMTAAVAVLSVLVLVLAFGAIQAAPDEAMHLTAVLSGDQEVPPADTDASGVARLVLDGDMLNYEVAVRNIDNITASHLHIGAPGVNGPVEVTLYDGTGDFDPDNPISGDTTLTAQQQSDILAGDYYVNIHTSDFPGGEIRGQVGAAATMAMRANLSAPSEVPPNDSLANGQAFFTLTADMTELHFRVLVSDIEGITAAHIHDGAFGVNGAVVFPLYTGSGDFGPGSPVSGTVIPTVSDVAAMLASDYYVNVHTDVNPGGEIRGQIWAMTPRSDSSALLSGEAEVPPVDTDALGVARFGLSADLGELDFYVAVDDISDITAAHLHTAWPGANGPVAHPLYTGGGSFGPGSPITGTLTLSAQDVLDLVSGYYYVNVHTDANPGGEIRGQVGEAALFTADLTGEQEVPPVVTEAGGRAVMALNDSAEELTYRVMVSDIDDITASHIHLGETGVNGPVAFLLYDGTGDFDPDNPISDTLVLTDEDLFDLMRGDYYVNVHTADYPGGEIRGQLWWTPAPTAYEAALDGAQEVPPVVTDATGEGAFSFDSGRQALHYNVMVDEISDITAAHIHLAPAGVNGGVVFALYTGMGTFDPDNPVGGAVDLTGANLVDLLTGYYYVNVHTSGNPGGEIRGQIGVTQPEPEAAVVYLPVLLVP